MLYPIAELKVFEECLPTSCYSFTWVERGKCKLNVSTKGIVCLAAENRATKYLLISPILLSIKNKTLYTFYLISQVRIAYKWLPQYSLNANYHFNLFPIDPPITVHFCYYFWAFFFRWMLYMTIFDSLQGQDFRKSCFMFIIWRGQPCPNQRFQMTASEAKRKAGRRLKKNPISTWH